MDMIWWDQLLDDSTEEVLVEKIAVRMVGVVKTMDLVEVVDPLISGFIIIILKAL